MNELVWPTHQPPQRNPLPPNVSCIYICHDIIIVVGSQEVRVLMIIIINMCNCYIIISLGAHIP